MYAHMHIHIYVYMCVYVCVYVCMYVYIYIYIYIYIYWAPRFPMSGFFIGPGLACQHRTATTAALLDVGLQHGYLNKPFGDFWVRGFLVSGFLVLARTLCWLLLRASH